MTMTVIRLPARPCQHACVSPDTGTGRGHPLPYAHSTRINQEMIAWL